MLVTTTTTLNGPASVVEANEVSLVPPGTNPPVIAVPEAHPIYGKTPMGRDGFVLERQSIHMLDYWHRKADEICQKYNAPVAISKEEQAYFEATCDVAWDIFRAAIKVSPNTLTGVATLLQLIVRHVNTHGGDDCAVLKLADLEAIAASAVSVAETPWPTKRVPALRKGKKLTRAGLIHRYQAFLIGELCTLGVSFYGSRDYPLRMSVGDDAVNVRLRGGKFQPFFNESKLADRAKSVLKSLKIDVVNAGDR